MFRDLLIANANKSGWSSLGYVTDGLVAAYDGQFNAGNSLHDPAATTWYNHVAKTADVAIPSGSVWGGDNVDIPDINIGVGGSSSVSVPAYTVCTDDYTARSQGSVQSQAQNGLFVLENNGAQVAYSSDAYSNLRYFVGTNYLKAAGGDNKVHSTTKMQYTIVFNRSSSAIWLNSANNTTGTLPTFTANAYRLFGNAAHSWNGYIWSVRIYNRALTASEIARNYAIDARRFNL